MSFVVSVRGAVTTENTVHDILADTRLMLQEIMEKNDILTEHIITVQFTATNDIDAVYPARAARELGILDAGLMCTQEMHVAGSLRKCVRVNMLINSKRKQNEAVHVYLKGAAVLRPDLVKH